MTQSKVRFVLEMCWQDGKDPNYSRESESEVIKKEMPMMNLLMKVFRKG